MSWRTLVITRSGRLRCKDRQLVWEDEGGPVEVPLEDLGVVVLEAHQVSLTVPVLSSLSQHGATLVVCDEKHQPVGMLLPLYQHSRGVEVLDKQISASKPLLKRCWQKVVKQKIANQAQVLKSLDIEGWEDVASYEQAVQSGDAGNAEAHAARIYWKKLFGKSFSRNALNIQNASLNYGYAIIRAAVARAIVAYGLQPGLGMGHESKLNNYNLADDLLEPFRPYVDSIVLGNMNEDLTELRPELKRKLLELLDTDVYIAGENHTLLRAADIEAMSYVTALGQKNPELMNLPRLDIK